MNKNKIKNNESLTVIDNVTETIITNQETIEAIEEGKKLIGNGVGYRDFEEFWKAVCDE